MNKEVLISYWPYITYKKYKDILSFFSCLEECFEATSAEFKHIGWNETYIDHWFSWKKNLQESAYEEELHKENIATISLCDPQYPKLLKEISDPPICLFIQGSTNLSSSNVAVVGTRKWTPYGKIVTKQLVQDLVQKQTTIVSGLALGIDAIAHTTTVETDGKTIAVLAGGVDEKTIAPKQHIRLAKQIIEKGGSILSEYPPKTAPTIYSFPKRNRIVSGISLGVLIIEAPASSGALITASTALEQGREVFVVPQDITSPTSIGVHTLLKQGATPVTCADDIITALGLQMTKKFVTQRDQNNIETLPPNMQQVLTLLSHKPIHIDILIRQSHLTPTELLETLTLMELDGIIQSTGQKEYVRV